MKLKGIWLEDEQYAWLSTQDNGSEVVREAINSQMNIKKQRTPEELAFEIKKLEIEVEAEEKIKKLQDDLKNNRT